MLIDRNKSEKDNLLYHINRSLLLNDDKIDPSEISFTYPRAIPEVSLDSVNRSSPNSEYVFDTIVTVIPSDEFDFNMPVDIRYRRLDIGLQYSFVNGRDTIDFKKKRSQTTLKEIKDVFCNKCRLRNDSIRIRIEDTTDELQKRVYLSPIDNSLLYTGVITAIVTFLPERLKLKDIITGFLNDIGL